jgi:hypothetical protein
MDDNLQKEGDLRWPPVHVRHIMPPLQYGIRPRKTPIRRQTFSIPQHRHCRHFRATTSPLPDHCLRQTPTLNSRQMRGIRRHERESAGKLAAQKGLIRKEMKS